MMAHWAEIDSYNKVIRVLVTSNDDPNGDEGFEWLIENFGGTWIQTSYNNRIRKNFAGIGYTYDSERDAFIPPKTFNSWILDETTCRWIASKPMPTDGKEYNWDEDLGDWVELAVE